MSHPTAAILIIGNEILSGRTQDLNVQHIAQHLSTIGINLKEVRIIPDDEQMIMDTVRTLSSQYTTVFTTGGIGATHDDITAASIAKAFGQKLILHDGALEVLTAFYGDRLNEARKRMAMIPEGAQLITNPLSAAPGFKIENVFCLAGIPPVMQRMFDYVIPQLPTGPKYFSRTIQCSVLENNMADELAIIQKQHPTVEIGSYPRYNPDGEYSLSLVLRGTDEELILKAGQEILALIRSHGEEVGMKWGAEISAPPDIILITILLWTIIL